jgi:hypothetical protein
MTEHAHAWSLWHVDPEDPAAARRVCRSCRATQRRPIPPR